MSSKKVSDIPEGPRPSWMRDIRKKLHRELLIKQAQPGVAVQSKVHYALQLRRTRETAKLAQAALEQEETHYSPSILPFTSNEQSSMFVAPVGLRTPHLQQTVSSLTSGDNKRHAKLAEILLKQHGIDDMTKQMIASYVSEHPHAVELLRKELKAERAAARRERQQASMDHVHVLPEELLFAGKSTAFPKKSMSQSNKEVIATRTGAPSRLSDRVTPSDSVERSSDGLLEPITVASRGRRLPALSNRTSNRTPSQLGDHLPAYAVGGSLVTFDPLTIASLTAQNAQLTEAVVAQQVEDYGPLLMVPIAEELHLVHGLHTPTAIPVHSKVDSGRTSPTRRSPVPQLDADPRSAIAYEELAAMAKHMYQNQLSETTSVKDDRTTKGSHRPHGVSHAAPDGLLKRLLREIDVDSDDSDDGDRLNPRCVLCSAAQPRRVRDLRLSSLHATEALSRWRALHQLSHVTATEALNDKLTARDDQSRIVAHNRHALAQVSLKAKHDAEEWLRSRSGGLGHDSVWEQPCHEIQQQQARWEACVLFWEKLRHFTEFVQWPQNDAQEDILRRLQTLLQSLKCLSVGLLILWMRSCGPSLTRLRENYRILTFVRCSFGVPQAALVAWCRLPAVKALSFELSVE